jgi:hypothetical protein
LEFGIANSSIAGLKGLRMRVEQFSNDLIAFTLLEGFWLNCPLLAGTSRPGVSR